VDAGGEPGALVVGFGALGALELGAAVGLAVAVELDFGDVDGRVVGLEVVVLLADGDGATGWFEAVDDGDVRLVCFEDFDPVGRADFAAPFEEVRDDAFADDVGFLDSLLDVCELYPAAAALFAFNEVPDALRVSSCRALLPINEALAILAGNTTANAASVPLTRTIRTTVLVERFALCS
jgi:hypothetical protein